jgi:hypothetical protein
MSRAFTKDDLRGQLLSKEADRILDLLDGDNDVKANGEDLFGVVENIEVVDSTSGVRVDLVDGGRVVGSTSAETSSVPDQGTQQAEREIESSDEMDPMLLLFTMLDSQRGNGKSLRDMLESLVNGNKQQPGKAAAAPAMDSNKDNNVTTLLEIIKLLLLSKDIRSASSDEKKEDLDLPTKPKKYAPKMKDEESVMGFFSFFKSQAKSWGVLEDSKMFMDYFESAIQDNREVRKEYWTIKNRHPDWKTQEIVHWLIEIVDEISAADVRRSFDKLIQGVNKSIKRFSSRFTDASDAVKCFDKMTDSQELDKFISKLLPDVQAQLDLYVTMGSSQVWNMFAS